MEESSRGACYDEHKQLCMALDMCTLQLGEGLFFGIWVIFYNDWAPLHCDMELYFTLIDCDTCLSGYLAADGGV